MTVQTDMFWGAAETPPPGLYDYKAKSIASTSWWTFLVCHGELWDTERISSNFYSATLCLLKGGKKERKD